MYPVSCSELSWCPSPLWPIFTSGCRAGMFLCRPWRCASWLSSKDNLAVLDEVLLVHGLTSPAGHMAWTGLVCAVLWRERLKVGHATLDWRVLGAFLTAVVLHALWDTFASLRSPTPVGAPAGRIETLELVAGGVLIPPGVLRRARRPTRARSLPLPSSLRSQ